MRGSPTLYSAPALCYSWPHFYENRPRLAQRDSELLSQLAGLGDLLLDKLAAVLDQPGFRREELLPLEDLKATAEVLHILTKQSWSEEDIDAFDRCWRDASRSDLFADEFEAERFRIQAAVDAARKQLLEPPAFQQGKLW